MQVLPLQLPASEGKSESWPSCIGVRCDVFYLTDLDLRVRPMSGFSLRELMFPTTE